MYFNCTKTFPSVPFAHRAPSHDGHCALIHGHNWTLTVEFSAKDRDENGFVFDFGKCFALKQLIGKFDHALVLNQTDPMLKHIEIALIDSAPHHTPLAKLVTVPDCSCEGLAGYFLQTFDKIVMAETNRRARVHRVTLHEDEKNSATAGQNLPAV